jgi:competence protein ComEC
MAAAATRRVPVMTAQAGMHWRSDDGVTLDILAPTPPLLADTGDDVNENSIVLKLACRDFSALFMGDAGQSSEARLIASGVDLRAQVVKVGHHGSRYGSTPALVAAVRPAIALVSVGRNNTFGHPAPSTVEAWRESGAQVFRTDQCGAITLMAEHTAATMLPCTRRD